MELVEKSMSHPDSPVCSICIANYNGRGVIDSTLHSVLAQDCEFPIEVIIHDDASTDDSVDFIRKNYPEVKLITSEVNVGFCVSNNRMVENSNGKYVLLLNNDAELFPDSLRRLYERACQQDRPGIIGLPQYNFFSRILIDRGSVFDPFLNATPNLDKDQEEVGMVIGACLWIPKFLWDSLGGFPEWFHTLGEDMFLCCLARLGGYSVSIIRRSGFFHRVGNSLGGGKVIAKQLSTSKKRRILSERNKSFVMAICYPAPMFQLLFTLHIALLFLEGILISLVKKDYHLFSSIYFSCITSLWKERTRLLHHRKIVQLSRKISIRRFFSVFLPTPYKLSMLVKFGIPEIK